MTESKVRSVEGKRRRPLKRDERPVRKGEVKNQEQAEVGFGTQVAALFAECGLDSPIPELRGYTIKPMKFDS